MNQWERQDLWSDAILSLLLMLIHFTAGTPSSVSSSVVLGQIPDEVLRVWSQLPEAIRLDPSLAVFQKEYDRVHEIAGMLVFFSILLHLRYRRATEIWFLLPDPPKKTWVVPTQFFYCLVFQKLWKNSRILNYSTALSNSLNQISKTFFKANKNSYRRNSGMKFPWGRQCLALPTKG